MKHLVILFFSITGLAVAEPPDANSLPSKLQGIASELFQALQEENIEKSMSLFHPDAPNRAATQKSYETAFPSTQISYELKDFSYIGKDDKFAVVRFTQSIGILELNGKKVTDHSEHEAVGHEMGRRILSLHDKKSADLDNDDYLAMRKVVGYVHRHMKQRPEGDVTNTRWRKSLMNWGHDPIDH